MKFLHNIFIFTLFLQCRAAANPSFHNAADPRFQYIGRVDFTDPLKPTMWATSAQVHFSFTGPTCTITITDQVHYGKNHNYIDVIVDGKLARYQLKEKTNILPIAHNEGKGDHTVIINKNSEPGIGYIIFEGAYCKKLVKSAPLPTRKLEFYGDSITSGMGNDTTIASCGKGEWYDQTNGYMTYAAITARDLNAQNYTISASGIGLIHSCCNMDIVMPQVYDKVNIRENKIGWDFRRYQPDIVNICLSQNDGIQDSALFCGAYVQYLRHLRGKYLNASFICISSPMADSALKRQISRYFPAIIAAVNDKKVSFFAFSQQFNDGCGSHPSGSQHITMAAELTNYIRERFGW